MKKLIFFGVVLFILTVPLVQLQSATSSQAQSTTSNLVLEVATPTVVKTDATATSGQVLVPEVDLKPGARHKEVKTLQKILKLTGYLPEELQLTEIFGPKTKAALIKFQKSQGLPATGAFDQATRLALKNHLEQRLMVKKEMAIKKMTTTYNKFNEFLSNLTSRLDKNVSTTCMKLAVENRENALVLAWEAYAAKIKSAYETRRNELNVAWGIADHQQRQTAIKNAWNKYHEEVKSARLKWNQSRKNSWLQFNQDTKNCKASIIETQEIEEVNTEE